MEMAVAGSGGEAGSERRAFGADHAVEALAHERIGEGSRNDPERGCSEEGDEPDADQRGREIHQPERKDRDEAQEQQIAECIRAESIGDALRARAGAAHQRFPARAARNGKDDGGAGGAAGNRREPAHEPAEQNAAANREHGRARDRERRNRDVERHERGDGRGVMLGHERVDAGAVPYQGLERQLPVPAHGQDQGHHHHDDRKRQKSSQPNRPGSRRAGAWDRDLSPLVLHGQRRSARHAERCLEKFMERRHIHEALACR